MTLSASLLVPKFEVVRLRQFLLWLIAMLFLHGRRCLHGWTRCMRPCIQGCVAQARVHLWTITLILHVVKFSALDDGTNGLSRSTCVFSV